MEPIPYRLSLEELPAVYRTDLTRGLTTVEAQRRLAQDGPNALREKPGPTVWEMFRRQVTEPLVLVLVAASAVSALVGEWTDAGMIMLIVIPERRPGRLAGTEG